MMTLVFQSIFSSLIVQFCHFNIKFSIMDVWIPYQPSIDKSTLMYAGIDSDGSPTYVGRAYHSSDLIPGKYLTGPNFAHRCHVSYSGQEFSKDQFEVLINTGYTWIASSNGQVPPNAVVGGRTASGEVLYVGRATHCGLTIAGKVQPSHQCAYIPFSWKEHRYTYYEVLVKNQSNYPPTQPPIYQQQSSPYIPPPPRPPPPIVVYSPSRPIVICPPRRRTVLIPPIFGRLHHGHHSHHKH